MNDQQLKLLIYLCLYLFEYYYFLKLEENYEKNKGRVFPKFE